MFWSARAQTATMMTPSCCSCCDRSRPKLATTAVMPCNIILLGCRESACFAGAAVWHLQQAMDPSVRVAEDEDLQKVVLNPDSVLVRAAAVAVGAEGLKKLSARFEEEAEYLKAAKVQYALTKTVSTTSRGAEYPISWSARASSSTSM